MNEYVESFARTVVRDNIPISHAMKQARTAIVMATLRATNGNVSLAARRLGVHRNTMHTYMRTYLRGFRA